MVKISDPQLVLGATGNNVQIAGDLFRRVVSARLEPREANPELRQDFRHPDIKKYVQENRLSLLADFFTIIRAYWLAGMPSSAVEPFGSFEAWSGFIRGALLFAGCADPLAHRRDYAAQADSSRALLEQLLESIQAAAPGGQGLEASEYCKLMNDFTHGKNSAEALRAVCEEHIRAVRPGQPVSPQHLGRLFGKFKGRISGNKRLALRPLGKGKNAWYVETINAAGCVGGAGGGFSGPADNSNTEPDAQPVRKESTNSTFATQDIEKPQLEEREQAEDDASETFLASFAS